MFFGSALLAKEAQLLWLSCALLICAACLALVRHFLNVNIFVVSVFSFNINIFQMTADIHIGTRTPPFNPTRWEIHGGTPRGLPRWCWVPISLNKNSARVGMGSPPTPVLGILAQHGPQGVPPPPFFGRGERGGAI